MKSAHEPVIEGLAAMVLEQTTTGLAGMDSAEMCIDMQRIMCSYIAQLCITWKP